MSGTPDYLICGPSGKPLWIEFKTEHGKLSPNQKLVIEKLTKTNYRVEIVRTVNDFIEIVEEYLSESGTK